MKRIPAILGFVLLAGFLLPASPAAAARPGQSGGQRIERRETIEATIRVLRHEQRAIARELASLDKRLARAKGKAERLMLVNEQQRLRAKAKAVERQQHLLDRRLQGPVW